MQSTTGYTPFFLVFGHQARLSVDIMHGIDKPLETTHGEFATRLKMTLESAYTLARENTHAKQERQKGFYNQKVHRKHFLLVTKCGFSPRQFLVVSPENSIIHGLDHGWLSGNCHAVYRIKALTGHRKQLVVHFDHLKLCPEDTRITAPCQPTVIEQSTTATQARPPLSDLEIIDEPERDPQPPISTPLPTSTPTPLPTTEQDIVATEPEPISRNISPLPPPRRYPQRRTMPDRYSAYITH